MTLTASQKACAFVSLFAAIMSQSENPSHQSVMFQKPVIFGSQQTRRMDHKVKVSDTY